MHLTNSFQQHDTNRLKPKKVLMRKRINYNIEHIHPKLAHKHVKTKESINEKPHQLQH